MSPGEPRTQDQRHAVDRDHIGETRAELAAGIAPIHGVEAQPETAAAEIGLAVARSMERLRLKSGVRRNLEPTYARWHDEAIAALKASTKAFAGELRGERITEREAVGGEPVAGEGKGCRNVSRTKIALAVDANLERIASATAEALRQAPIGAAAGEREPCQRVWRKMIIHAAGKTVVACGDIVRADDRIAVAGARAPETRSPCGPALIGWLLRRRLEHRGICKRDGRRKARLLIRR